MTYNESVSAGTARPDAAPTLRMSDDAEKLLANLYTRENKPGGWAEFAHHIFALRSVLAERDAECEGLRADEKRIDWLATECGIIETDMRSFYSIRIAQSTPEMWAAFDDENGNLRAFLDAAMASAAVAPAARETQETTDE